MGIEAETDWTLPEALHGLALCGEREIVSEVLALFQSDTQSRLRALRGSVQAGDRRRARMEAHSLKGSAVQVGAIAMAELCAELELTAETRPELESVLEQIEARFAAVSKAISLEYGVLL